MLPRVLRVVRAKAIKKTALALQAARPDSKGIKNANKTQIYNPKVSSQVSSLQGRAGKLLGRAGAARIKKSEGSGANEVAIGAKYQGKNGSVVGLHGIAKTPESIVFEGYRASAKSGKPKDLKLGGKGSGKSKGKPRTRSSKRASEWKKGTGKVK
jgi:nucleolar protein 12